jgi:hypothetical protein
MRRTILLMSFFKRGAYLRAGDELVKNLKMEKRTSNRR